MLIKREIEPVRTNQDVLDVLIELTVAADKGTLLHSSLLKATKTIESAHRDRIVNAWFKEAWDSLNADLKKAMRKYDMVDVYPLPTQFDDVWVFVKALNLIGELITWQGMKPRNTKPGNK